jgi:hypothetical protein
MADGDTTEERLNKDPLLVDASPTKSFFVSIITRDVQLDDAIADLVDNCVDGAKRLRKGGDLTGLWVNISVSKDRFSIEDNCGGIPLDIARRYAFKFGRDRDYQDSDYSVGQFGVGMKRTLFKLGTHFSVETVEPQSSYKIEVPVTQWLGEADWDFHISDLTPGAFAADQLGTKIVVDELHEPVAHTLGQGWFQRDLRGKIQRVQQNFMRNGLNITFNGVTIIPDVWGLKEGEGIEPFFKRFEDDLGGQHLLQTRLYAGIGSGDRRGAGWYVFCNGRCIVEADQSSLTGWGEAGQGGISIPRYHAQFGKFRGYAFLDCRDASLLPWNTTKTSIDVENPAYRRLLGRMVDAARPVIDFLNALDGENDFAEEERDLSASVAKAAHRSVEALTERPSFTYKPPETPRVKNITISYKKPPDEVDTMKEVLGVSTNRDAGTRTFELAWERLVEE